MGMVCGYCRKTVDNGIIFKRLVFCSEVHKEGYLRELEYSKEYYGQYLDFEDYAEHELNATIYECDENLWHLGEFEVN